MAELRPRLVLASASGIRRQLLTGAGLSFDVDPADIDERALAAKLAALSVPKRAKSLAEAKALAVAARHQGAIAIGADQMLEIDGDGLSKARDETAARAVLIRLRGRAHHLHSGVALAKDGKVDWSFVQSACLHVRAFTEGWLDAYMSIAGEAATKSVGAYQLEGLGVQLFERIEGDYFTVLGLPLLPLLTELRRLGCIED